MLHHNTRRMRRTWSGRFPDDSSWITTEEQTVIKGKLTFITILVLFKPPWTHKITCSAYWFQYFFIWTFFVEDISYKFQMKKHSVVFRHPDFLSKSKTLTGSFFFFCSYFLDACEVNTDVYFVGETN